MVIPIIVGIGAAIAGAVGVGKTVKAISDSNEAKEKNAESNSIVEKAKSGLERKRKKCGESLEALGQKKVDVLDKSMNKFIRSFEKLHNVELSESVGLEELSKFRIDRQSLVELKELGSYASSIAGGTAAGLVGGALTAFGAYSATMALATASTGTAIATLSGAAATNATLAFLGGGSLAAGGLGMAGGMAVLGGLVAGPALAVMGFIVGSKASAALDEAKSNLAKAGEIREELKTAGTLCDGIRKRCDMFTDLLAKLDTLFVPLIHSMEKAIKTHGNDFQTFTVDEKKAVCAAATIAGTIKKVLDTPILTKDGKLTVKSGNVVKEISAKVEKQLS